MKHRFLLLAAACSVIAPLSAFDSQLINGKLVPKGEFSQVVKIKMNDSECTATIVGARSLLTAAHCVSNGAKVNFEFEGVAYTATATRHPNYPGKDQDIALLLTETDIVGAQPVSIGGQAEEGLGVLLLGYGCIKEDKPAPPPIKPDPQPQPDPDDEDEDDGDQEEDDGESDDEEEDPWPFPWPWKTRAGTRHDGLLRSGPSVIVGFSGSDMILQQPGGSALCFGDSGGPAFTNEAGNWVQLGVNSKGNIEDKSFDSRLDLPEAQDFLKSYAKDKGVEICGINAVCKAIPVK